MQAFLFKLLSPFQYSNEHNISFEDALYILDSLWMVQKELQTFCRQILKTT